MMNAKSQMQIKDKDLFLAIEQESTRQKEGLELIASENYVSPAVLEAGGSILTNKYAEGYPGKRYYGGCAFVDKVEALAIQRAKDLFSAEHANVQPHSGSQANMAVYFAVAPPGATIMGLDLAHGGHLTHGAKVSFSGSFFNSVSYKLDPKTHLLDYNQIEDQAKKLKPRVLIAGHSAYPRKIDFKIFREIADRVSALLLVDMAHIAGLVAGGQHPSPIPYSHFVTSTTHKTLRGPRGGLILCTKEYQKQIDKAIFPGLQGGPLMHIIAGKAVAFKEASQDSFKVYAKNIVQNAKALAKALISYDFSVITGGTDNHLILIDLSNKKITGKQAEVVLDQAGITLNKNTVPGETLSPFITSGVRIGTPAITTRGMGEEEMKQIAAWINSALKAHKDSARLNKIKQEVRSLCLKFPCPA